MWLRLLVLIGAYARGETWTLRVPAGQGLTEWADALALTGLDLARNGQPGSAAIIQAEGRWWLQIEAPDGTRRRATIPAPFTDAAREEIARQARNMLADPGQGVESRWEPDLSALRPRPPPLPEPALPEPARPEPAEADPPLLVPRYGIAVPPPAGPVEGGAAWTQAPIPAQAVSYLWALHPPRPQADATVEAAGWLRAGGAVVWRPEAAAVPGLLGEGGVALGEGRWQLGGGASWHPRARFIGLDGERAMQATAAYLGAWWQPEPSGGEAGGGVQVGLMAGGALLRFHQEGAEVDRLARPAVGVEVAYGGPIQVFVRGGTEVWPVDLVEVEGSGAAEEALGTVLPGIWGGVRVAVLPAAGRKN